MQANLARFTELNTQVLGISVDSVYAHKAYAEKLGGLDFPLLADFHPKGAVAQAYGIWNAERGISYRTVILIDENGIVRHAQVFERGLPDVDELVERIKSIN